MSFKKSDMHDVGEKPMDQPMTSGKRKWYPSIDLTEKELPKLKDLDFDKDVTIHAHAKITGKNKRNNDPARFTIELHKIGIKPGHNPGKEYVSRRWVQNILGKIKKKRKVLRNAKRIQ